MEDIGSKPLPDGACVGMVDVVVEFGLRGTLEGPPIKSEGISKGSLPGECENGGILFDWFIIPVEVGVFVGPNRDMGAILFRPTECKGDEFVNWETGSLV